MTHTLMRMQLRPAKIARISENSNLSFWYCTAPTNENAHLSTVYKHLIAYREIHTHELFNKQQQIIMTHAWLFKRHLFQDIFLALCWTDAGWKIFFISVSWHLHACFGFNYSTKDFSPSHLLLLYMVFRHSHHVHLGSGWHEFVGVGLCNDSEKWPTW